MLGVEAILLLLPALVSLIYGEFSGVYFLIPSGILIVIYLLVGMKKPEKRTIYGKEGMVIVASAWILWSLFGALPFTISGSIPSYLDAFFENGIRLHNDRVLHSYGCRSPAAGYAVLEKFYPLDRRLWACCVCHGADNPG